MNRFEAIEKTIGRTCMNFARNIRQLCFTSIISLFMFQFAFILASTAPFSRSLFFSYLLYFIFLSLVLVTALNESQLLPCHCLNFVSPCPFTRPSLLFNFPLASSIFIPRANQHGRGDR